MTITAKFASICPVCKISIEIGDKVEWSRGQRAFHSVCPTERPSFRPAFVDENLPETLLAIREMHEDEPAYRHYDADDYSYDTWMKEQEQLHGERILAGRNNLPDFRGSNRVNARLIQATDADDASYEAWLTFQAKLAECGVYVLPDETIVRIKMNRENTGNYAMRWTHIGGSRLTEAGSIENAEYQFAPELRSAALASRKMTRDEAVAFSLRYGICAWCGRQLKAAKSVAAGIGPVCIKRFPEGTTAADLMVAA